MEPTAKAAGDHVLATPAWVFAVRIGQVLLSVIVLGLAAGIAHDAYLDELGLALAIAIITWIIVAYMLVSERVPSCRPAYHIIAVVVLDGLLVVLWLATFAAVAARRAQFNVDVSVHGCANNGSLFNSEKCLLGRGVARRSNVVLFKQGGNMMAAIAGLGALTWILFTITFVWTVVHFVRGRKEGRFPVGTTEAPAGDTYQMEPKVEQPQPQPQQLVSPQSTGPYPQPQGPYHQQPHSPPPQAYSPPPQGQQAYAEYPSQQHPHQQYPQQPSQQYPPQQYPQQPSQPYPPQQHPSQQYELAQPQGSELPAAGEYGSPTPALQQAHHQQY